ncbi:putative uncharacterized protein [Waddlia chondrophila 2032/99]|uniref:Uncharacterized protein n=2 Tax=Waddlia chondrophila TaxID=71667 RepID=D6YUD2_WADCW|nr:hypothetical protein [Waddlia chondrophila]ADI37743.1 hypothetical protein wcw_0371 [Waddlia chondrophila WSU 86-1044]CCB90760.1 putative uncharacterized protein [Waddlia chondrophila 2032/99]
MYLEDFNEFKETLNSFHQTLRNGVENDSEYEGEADELLGSLERVQEKIKSIENIDQLKETVGPFGWDFLQVYLAIDEIMAMDDEDFDFEENEENASV